jgi:hypothetical protein
MDKRPELTREYLIEQYITFRKRQRTIAKETGYGKSTIGYYIKKYNIKISKLEVDIRNSESQRGEKGNFFGRHHTPDTIRLLSEINKGENNPRFGKTPSESLRKAYSERFSGKGNPFYGKKHTEKTKRLLGELNSKPHTPEEKIKIGLGVKGKMSGEKHPNWRGGISFEPYCEKFNGEFREHIREKFGRKCYLCPHIENGRKLSVHHIDYNRNSICNGKEWTFVPLCVKCHSLTNFNRWHWFNLLICYWAMNEDINWEATHWQSKTFL